MGISRREFILSAGAFAGLRAFAAPAGAFLSGKPELVFGILSDIHIDYRRAKADGKYNLNELRGAFGEFKRQGVDAVAICGDLANFGMRCEFDAIAQTWDEFFPAGCGVEKLFVTGNHDWEGWMYARNFYEQDFAPAVRERETLSKDYKRHWEECFHEPYAPIWMKRVKGYAFVGAHWLGCGADKKGRTCHGKDENFNDGIAAFYAAHAAELKGAKPFFHLQHPHPKDTCFGPKAWGRDAGMTTKVLSSFPNAVALSGHSHYALTDEQTVWQGAFTSVNCGSLRYAARPEPDWPRGYENGYGTDDGTKFQWYVNTGTGNPAMIAHVYKDRIVLSRFAVDSMQPLGDDWVIPLDASVRPFDYAKRAAALPLPAFREGAALALSMGKASNRQKEPRNNVTTVAIPAADAVRGARAQSYVVKAIGEKGETICERRVIADGFNLPKERATTPCLFNEDALPPAANCRFSVVARDCWGRSSKPLVGGWPTVGWGPKDVLDGRCDRDVPFYAAGEKMTFTFDLKGFPTLNRAACRFAWKRTGDDGKTETGEAPADRPLVLSTALDRPGFVRYEVELRGADGKRILRRTMDDEDNQIVRFDGGAGADVRAIRAAVPAPADFESFWARRKRELAAVAWKGRETVKELASGTKDVALYAVSIPCAGGRPATGFLSVPTAARTGKRYPALISFYGYEGSWSTFASQQPAPKRLRKDVIQLFLSAHGYELMREPKYYAKFRKRVSTNGADVAFDPVANADAEKAYFRGMTFRVMRALDYLKARPEWNGRDLTAQGGSMGGLQTIWAAALDGAVTLAKSEVPWCCDIGGTEKGRNRGDWYVKWVPALGYYDPVNMARLIGRTCRVEIPRVGLGDYICPPTGVTAFFNALACAKRVLYFQNSRHGYVAPEPFQRGEIRTDVESHGVL